MYTYGNSHGDDMIAHTCPRCDGDMIRVRRRLVDRFVSLFVGVRRFRCVSPACNWEGNVRRTSGRVSAAPASLKFRNTLIEFVLRAKHLAW